MRTYTGDETNVPVETDSAGGQDKVGPSKGASQSHEEIWEVALGELKANLTDANFTSWFQHTKSLALEGENFVLGVPSVFAKEWIENHHRASLEQAVELAAGTRLSITLVPDESIVLDEVIPSAEIALSSNEVAVASPPAETMTLIPKYNFDSFVIGSSNRFAHAAALAVAEAPAQAYNPLFIYGGAGLGKTHLLHAIGRYVRDFHSNLVVRYVSTEQFMNEFILALKRRTIPQFHQRFRAADLLLIDDIQFLEGKERTQEEFFHTFNALHPRSQIVVTSDRPPKKISTLEERLRTRFEWGLLTDIQPPDLETRLAILQKKSEADGITAPPEVLSFIAGRIQTNIRELEGALIRVAAYASLTRSEMTLELAQNVLHSLFPNEREARVTADLVISVAADYFGLTPDELRSSSRTRPLVDARQMAMYLCRELTDLSLPKIGERFGGRDHSTVVHAAGKIRNNMQEHQTCYEQVSELTERIKQRAARG